MSEQDYFNPVFEAKEGDVLRIGLKHFLIKNGVPIETTNIKGHLGGNSVRIGDLKDGDKFSILATVTNNGSYSDVSCSAIEGRFGFLVGKNYFSLDKDQIVEVNIDEK